RDGIADVFSQRTRQGFGLVLGVRYGCFECRSAGNRFVRGPERKRPDGDSPGPDRGLNDFADAAEFTDHHANEAADLIGAKLDFCLWGVSTGLRTGGAAAERIETGLPDLRHVAVTAEWQ